MITRIVCTRLITSDTCVISAFSADGTSTGVSNFVSASVTSRVGTCIAGGASVIGAVDASIICDTGVNVAILVSASVISGVGAVAVSLASSSVATGAGTKNDSLCLQGIGHFIL